MTPFGWSFSQVTLYSLPVTETFSSIGSRLHLPVTAKFQRNVTSHTRFIWKEVKEQIFLISELSPVDVLETQIVVGTLLLRRSLHDTAHLLLPVCHVWLHHFHTHSFRGQLTTRGKRRSSCVPTVLSVTDGPPSPHLPSHLHLHPAMHRCHLLAGHSPRKGRQCWGL